MGPLTNKIKKKNGRIERGEKEREKSDPNIICAWFKQLQIKKRPKPQFNSIE